LLRGTVDPLVYSLVRAIVCGDHHSYSHANDQSFEIFRSTAKTLNCISPESSGSLASSSEYFCGPSKFSAERL
ncbi:hypothetical protein BgiMline_000452, partial [Biomphalaria glabrata]